MTNFTNNIDPVVYKKPTAIIGILDVRSGIPFYNNEKIHKPEDFIGIELIAKKYLSDLDIMRCTTSDNSIIIAIGRWNDGCL